MTGDVVVNGSLRHLNSAALTVWVRRRERVAASRVSAHAVEVRLERDAIGASTRSKLARAQVRSRTWPSGVGSVPDARMKSTISESRMPKTLSVAHVVTGDEYVRHEGSHARVADHEVQVRGPHG